MKYSEFLNSKAAVDIPTGFEPKGIKLNRPAFDFQRDVVNWGVRRGRAALFEDCGLGKTVQQLAWAEEISAHADKTLIVAPLAVADQTIREGEIIGVAVRRAAGKEDIDGNGIYITNYAKLHRFDPSVFDAVVLDESSILKSYDGATRKLINESFKHCKFKLACTATPAPNDYMELGNHAEFLGVMKPGRLVAIHCMDLPTSKQFHGVIGLRDFPGDIIREFEAEGFIYHSKVTIWKDPVTAMQRTKALGLLHKTIRKDSAMSRQGVPDYLVVMRKPGVNAEPIHHTHEQFPVEQWQRFASPVWASMAGIDDKGFFVCCNPGNGADECGIDAGNTLQREEARDGRDERHICPLQLEVIERAVALWSNPGDVVFSPFAGIGSEGYQSIKMGRKFIGIELKPSYFKVACENLAMAQQRNETLFV